MTEEHLERTPLTRTQLIDDARALGVERGSILMLPCSLSSLGCVIGGADTVVRALLEALGHNGTLMTVTGWESDSYHLDEWPEPVRAAYLADPPGFDPRASEAARYVGRLPERIRTWPGARRSDHPEASFAATGAGAEWLVGGQPFHHPYGPGSPLAKLVEAEGRVLLLGAPLNSITLLHHAEELAQAPNKKIVHYRASLASPEGVEWVEIEDIDTSNGAFPYSDVVGDRDSFDVIGEEALASGIGRRGKVGEAESHLFPARELVAFAIAWMEKHFA